jgi:hypothetical protein
MKKMVRASRFRFQKKEGQVLVEALVALGILTVGLLGISTLLSRSLSLNRVVSTNYAGTYLAAEGIEIVKNIIDTNVLQSRAWNDLGGNGDYEADFDDSSLGSNQSRFLAFDPATNIYSYGGPQATPFRRLIRIALTGSDEVKVNSIVSWSVRGGDYQVNLEDHFLRWRQ